MQTNSQLMARAAYARVTDRAPSDEYRSFAREFPTLVHACGLAQAVAFSCAKGGVQQAYVEDLTAVLREARHTVAADARALAAQTRSLPVMGYLRLGRSALAAA